MNDEETGFVALNSDMYFTCSSGLAPAKMCPTQTVAKTKENHYYLVKDDTATQNLGDFFCRWTVVIAAAIAAAGIVTGGAALAVLVVVAVSASMALCGGLMAPLRKWAGYSTLNEYGRRGAYTLTSKCTMVCPIGGVATYAPGITSQWQALAYTARNTVWAVVEGAIVGKLGSSGFSAFAGTATPTMATALGNFLFLNASARGIGAADQILFEGMLRNGKSLSECGEEAKAGLTMFEQPFLNIWDKASGNNPQPLNWQDFYYAALSLAGMKMMAETATTHESIPAETIKQAKETISKIQKSAGKLFERGKAEADAGNAYKKPNFDEFVNNVDGGFPSDEMAQKAFELFNKGDWKGLENLFNQHGINGGWPPNRGFVSTKTTSLEPGFKFDRYGGRTNRNTGKFEDTGGFIADEGTPFGERGLPADYEHGKPLNSYEVIKRIEGVKEGEAIPWFGQKGGGMQYEIPATEGGIDGLLNNGKIIRK